LQDKPNGAYHPGPALHAVGMAAISRLDVRRIAQPAHASAVGKAILAALPDSELGRRYPGEELPAPTPASITSRHELMRELSQVRRQGYALNWEESSDGARRGGANPRAAAPGGLTPAPVSRPARRPRSWELLGAVGQGPATL
jgi:DNA-binding IclR family transcriptional regulator